MSLINFVRIRILALPPYYNSIRTFYLPQYKKFFLQKYTEQDWLEGSPAWYSTLYRGKPWNQFTVQFQLWWQYYEQLPEIIKKEWQVDKKIYSYLSFIEHLAGPLW